MVTAGIFLIIKCSALFEFSYTVLSILVFWGAITSIFAATSGLFLSDIKKVIAYSTCSQLGYMLLTCGFSNYNLSLFHLMNHAIFKAALFLCAGAIIHSLSNEQDMRRMGGLINFLPISYMVMFIASLAIIGFPFLTGFYSKDIIFEVVFNSFGSVNIFIYWIISITAFFTTVYSFRLLYFIFLNNNNSFRHYILNIHESSYAISISLLVLAFGSITSGFLFKDLFLGFGNFFLISNILPVIKNLNIFDSEFISTSVKLVPLLMGVLGICFCSFLILFAKKYLYYYTFFGNLVLNFLINKWYFDYIYNFYINLYIFDFAKRYIYKIIDKGMLEFFGPFGFWQILNYSNFKLLKTQNGFISYYLFYYSFFLFLFIYILKIDFFSFHILSFTFLGNVLNSSFFIKIKHFYLTQRFLFRCVKTQIIVEYLRTMNFFLEDPEINYWLLFEELLEDDDAFIQKVSRPLFNWELWSPITTYDMLWLKSFLHFGFIYWPKNTLVFLFGVLGILTFVVSYLYVFLYQNIIDFFWFFIIFFCRDIQQIFCLDHGGDLWFFFYIAVIGVFYFFSVTVYHFWNVGYAKLFILLRQNSVFSIMIQDFILLFFNFFFVIVLGILFLCIIGLCWDSVLDMAKDMEYNRLEYDPMYHIKRWRHFRYYFKRERTYKYWAHHSFILKYFCQNLEILSRPRIKIARDTVWKTANYMQTFILLDSYRNTESLLYTNDLITPYFNWVTWEALTPFRFIYTPVFSIVLWKDTFDIFFVLLLVICIGLKYENPYVLVDEYGRHILPEETLFYVRLTYSTVLIWYVSFMLFSEIFPYILYFINLALLGFWRYYLRKLELNLADFLQLPQTDRARLAHVDMLKNRIIIHLKVNFDLFIYPYWCIFISYFSTFQCKFSYYSNRAWAFIFGNNYFISSLRENLKFALSSKYGLVFLWLLNLTLIKIQYLCTFINNSYYKLYYFVWERFYNCILNNSEFFYFFGKYFLNLPFRIFLNFCKKSLKLYFKYFNKVKRT